MPLFISNPTKQNYVFHYRLMAEAAEDRILQQVVIPSGGGVEIGKRWSSDQIEKVITQLETYGARNASETKGSMGKFNGLLYRENRQITSDEIRMGHDYIVETQEVRAASEATKAALGFDRSLNTDSRGRRGTRMAKVSRVEVIEQVDPRERPTGNEVNFDLTVDPESNGRVEF